MSFSVYQHHSVKHKADSVSSINDSLKTISATLPLGSEIRRIEAALLSLSSILDCIVVEPMTDTTGTERVAYIVSSTSIHPQQLHSQLQKILPTTPLPVAYIPLDVLPLTARGEVNCQALNIVDRGANRVQREQSSIPSPYSSSTLSDSSCDQPIPAQGLSDLPLSDLPLYQKSWHIKPLASEISFNPTAQTVILMDQLGFGSVLCEQLDQLNQPYIKVEPGSDFAQLSANHYYLNPVHPAHYHQLLESILTENVPVTQILHLWTYHESFRAVLQEKALEYSLDLGVHSLEFLSQALAATQGENYPVRLLVATNQTQTVQPIHQKYRTPEIRLLQTLSQEQSWLDCCHLDLPEVELIDNVHRILQELSAVPCELEVTYHQNQRWVAKVEPVTASAFNGVDCG